MLTNKEFEILIHFADQSTAPTQRELSALTGFSIGTTNGLVQSLTQKEYIKNRTITKTGLTALEPYKVKRAIFLAAGFGSRLVPITLNTPKPLIRVHGTRIIDTLLDAVIAAEIPEIIIVRGYLGEQFDQLIYKYPNIKFVENSLFNETNNISSALQVCQYFENAYVFESDLLLKNPSLIRKYEYRTNFLGIPTERCDDWCFTTNSSGSILSQTSGGINCYQMIGISYWDHVAGEQLCNDIQAVYHSPGGKERFWEQTATIYHKEHYDIKIRTCEPDDVIEIDTYNELKALDELYAL